MRFNLKLLTILIFSAMLFTLSVNSASALSIEDGDLITTADSPDVFIVKIKETEAGNIKKFKRLILNPEIFDSYGHLSWDNIKEVSNEVLNTFTVSDMVLEINPDGSVADPKVYRVSSALNSDVGERRWLNLSPAEFEYMGYDWDALYYINHTEASPSFYPEDTPITYDRGIYAREYFTVYRGEDKEKTLEKLELDGFINSAESFSSLVPGTIQAGGYALDTDMTEAEVASLLNADPFMIWITVPEGYRKEQIGELLASKLGWSEVQKDSWLTAYQKLDYKPYENAEDYKEGVYFPDTYLFPKTEGPVQAASRMINNFNRKFADYVEAFSTEHSVGWQNALTLASMVQREASGAEDARLVAGILWNRIEADMAFQLDATIQYALNTAETGWWAPISSSDRDIDSPFNTYMYKGIPPHSISNPGLISIDAILSPQETDCIFFIHAKREIYCSATYQGHLNNIEKYLRV